MEIKQRQIIKTLLSDSEDREMFLDTLTFTASMLIRLAKHIDTDYDGFLHLLLAFTETLRETDFEEDWKECIE